MMLTLLFLFLFLSQTLSDLELAAACVPPLLTPAMMRRCSADALEEPI